MSANDINKTVKELKELKAMQEELQAEITSLEDIIKAEMLNRGCESLQAGCFKVLYKTVKTTRFDTKAFRATHSELYAQYTKETEYKRFLVA